jgi:hypothetical protein
VVLLLLLPLFVAWVGRARRLVREVVVVEEAAARGLGRVARGEEV